MADQRLGGLTCGEADDMAAAFVLGALTEQEMAAVRLHLAECGAAHSAFVELGSVAPALLESVPVVEAPAGLGARIMAAAREERAGQIASAWQPDRVATTKPSASSLVVAPPVASRRPAVAWIALAAAAVLVIAALGIWNFQLRGQVDELSAYRSAVAGVIDRAANGGQVAILTNQLQTAGTTTPNTGIAGIGTDGSVAVAMTHLTPTTGTEVYEIWLIGGDGRPVPVGDFTVGANGAGGTVTVSGSKESGITVALTHEPGPGATTPTLPIVALGTSKPAGS